MTTRTTKNVKTRFASIVSEEREKRGLKAISYAGPPVAFFSLWQRHRPATVGKPLKKVKTVAATIAGFFGRKTCGKLWCHSLGATVPRA
jgi:hypothetical protein